MEQNNNPLTNTTIQLAIAAAVFIVVMLTVGQSWTPEQIRDLLYLIIFAFGVKEGIPRVGGLLSGGMQAGTQTAPPTSAPISQEEQDLRIKVRQYEQDIELLLLAQDERDALVYTFNQLGLRVTVRVNR